MQRIKFQLYESGAGITAGQMITASGGFVYVAKSADAQKETLSTKAGASQANGFALTSGGAEFYVADTVSQVDLYIMSPGGQFVVKTGVKPGAIDIAVNVSDRNQVAVIPFSINDTTAATETDTGFDMPLYALVEPSGPAIRVLTADAAITMGVGLKASETAGNATGFIAAASVATVGLLATTLANGAQTVGALLKVASDGGTVNVPKGHAITGSNATSVTYTLLTAADTAEGFILLPYILGA